MDSKKKFSELERISSFLAAECGALRFGPKAAVIYNPLEYAIRPHRKYLELAGAAPKRIIFLGMNPGPWGMAQTGVPFGEIAAVRDWLGIEEAVDKPAREHPKRPIEGFACARSEVSGRRLWGLFRERFTTPENFFREHFVANYCPLVFMNPDGANITPDKLPREEAAPLFKICDRALADTIDFLKPQWVVGVGGFAKKMAVNIMVQAKHKFSAAQVLHPSPANPRANAGWQNDVEKVLLELEIWK